MEEGGGAIHRYGTYGNISRAPSLIPLRFESCHLGSVEPGGKEEGPSPCVNHVHLYRFCDRDLSGEVIAAAVRRVIRDAQQSLTKTLPSMIQT